MENTRNRKHSMHHISWSNCACYFTNYQIQRIENKLPNRDQVYRKYAQQDENRSMWFGLKVCVYGQRQLDIKMMMGARRPRNTFMLKPFQKHLIQIENRKQTTKSRKQKTNRQIKKIYRRSAQQDEDRCGSVRKPTSTDEERHLLKMTMGARRRHNSTNTFMLKPFSKAST